jgi:hypothetical protein
LSTREVNMNGFVARASHFVAHPFGLHIHLFSAAAPAGGSSKRSSMLPTSSHSDAEADLSWLSLEAHEPEAKAKDPSADLCWLSLEAHEPVPDDSHENLTWFGLEEHPHRDVLG